MSRLLGDRSNIQYRPCEMNSISCERRLSPRTQIDIKVAGITSWGSCIDLRVLDLSATGCAVASAGQTLSAGTAYEITIPGLEPLRTRAVRLDGVVAGLKFDRPLYPAVADHFALLHRRDSALPSDDETGC
jgi:hypothetical protein